MTEPKCIVKGFAHKKRDAEDAYFNATAAAKPFGKEPKEWLRTEEAKRYVEAIAKRLEREQDQLVIVKNGSPSQGGGTWMHTKLMETFAQWLAKAQPRNHNVQLYAVLFSTGALKVGRSHSAPKRIRAHQYEAEKYGVCVTESFWCEAGEKTEIELIAFCSSLQPAYLGNEYFKDIPFELVKDWMLQKPDLIDHQAGDLH